MGGEHVEALVLIDIQNDYFPGGKWALEWDRHCRR